MANVTASMENVAKNTLWQSNESSYLKSRMKECVNSNFDASAIFFSCAADNVGA